MSELIQEYELGPKQTDQLTDGLFKKNDGTTWVRYAGVDYQVTGDGLPATGWTPEGDVLTVQSDVRHFPFAYNTAGLTAGAALYTPTIGDILLDAWVEVDTAWDGTTPHCDVGQNLGVGGGKNSQGWFGAAYNGLPPIDMTIADDNDNQAGSVLVAPQTSDLHSADVLNTATLVVTADTGTGGLSNASGIAAGLRNVPAKFQSADPVQVMVNTTGQGGGSSPGATQGAAILYLITATPA